MNESQTMVIIKMAICIRSLFLYFKKKKSGTHDTTKLKVGVVESNFSCNWLIHRLTVCDSEP